MNRQRKIDEDLWEDGEEKLSSDHVVERCGRARAEARAPRSESRRPRHRPAPRSLRRTPQCTPSLNLALPAPSGIAAE